MRSRRPSPSLAVCPGAPELLGSKSTRTPLVASRHLYLSGVPGPPLPPTRKKLQQYSPARQGCRLASIREKKEKGTLRSERSLLPASCGCTAGKPQTAIAGSAGFEPFEVLPLPSQAKARNSSRGPYLRCRLGGSRPCSGRRLPHCTRCLRGGGGEKL